MYLYDYTVTNQKHNEWNEYKSSNHQDCNFAIILIALLTTSGTVEAVTKSASVSGVNTPRYQGIRNEKCDQHFRKLWWVTNRGGGVPNVRIRQWRIR